MKRLLLIVLSMLAVWIILSVIMMWPPFSRYTGESYNSCLNNLLQIQGAKEQFILETGLTNGPIDPSAVAKYLLREPRCNAGGTYTFGNFGEDPSCSLATGPIPKAQKERVSIIGWKWKVWPSTPRSHRLPERTEGH